MRQEEEVADVNSSKLKEAESLHEVLNLLKLFSLCLILSEVYRGFGALKDLRKNSCGNIVFPIIVSLC